MSDAGQAESYDSDPGKAPGAVTHRTGDYFSHIFNSEGRYTFHCKVHPSMRGTIVVQPAVNLAPDFTPPLISALRAVPTRGCARRTARCTRTSVHLRFLLSEDADVSVLVERLRRGRRPVTARNLNARGRQGPNDIRVSVRRLRAGRYRASLSALDAVGNLSSVRSVRFTVVAG